MRLWPRTGRPAPPWKSSRCTASPSMPRLGSGPTAASAALGSTVVNEYSEGTAIKGLLGSATSLWFALTAFVGRGRARLLRRSAAVATDIVGAVAVAGDGPQAARARAA